MDVSFKEGEVFFNNADVDGGESKINLYKAKNDIVHFIPLLSGNGNMQMVLIGSRSNKNHRIGLLGKQTRINLEKTISSTPNQIEVETYEFEKIIYSYNNQIKVYENKQKQETIKIEKDFYIFTDAYGNKTYQKMGARLPYLIVNKNESKYTISMTNHILKIQYFVRAGMLTEEIRLKIEEDLIQNIQYIKFLNSSVEETIQKTAEFSYVDKNLYQMKLKNENDEIMQWIEYQFDEKQWKIKDKIHFMMSQYQIENQEIKKIQSGSSQNEKENPYFTINYSAKSTEIEDFRKQKQYYFFDNEGKFVYRLDTKGYGQEKEFQKQNGRILLTKDSYAIYCKDNSFNLIKNGFFENETNWVSSYPKDYGLKMISEEPWNEILKNCLQIDSLTDNQLSQTIMQNWQEKDLFFFCCFIQGTLIDKQKFKVKIDFDNEENYEVLPKLEDNERWNWLTFHGKCQKAHQKVTIHLLSQQGCQIKVSGVQFIRNKIYGKEYDYDSEGNLKTVIVGQNIKHYQFNQYRQLQKIMNQSNQIFENGYDTKGNLITSLDDENYQQNFYNENNNCIEEQLWKANQKDFIDKEAEYDDFGNVIKEKNVLNQICRYTYYQSNLLVQKKINGQKWNYQYTPKNQLKEINVNNEQNRYFAYDNLGNVKSITQNEIGYFYSHNAYGQIQLIQDETNRNLKRIEYDKYDDSIYTGQIKRCANPLGEVFTYHYTQSGKLKEISQNDTTLCTYTYAEDGNLQLFQDDIANQTSQYFYNQNQMLIEENKINLANTKYFYNFYNDLYMSVFQTEDVLQIESMNNQQINHFMTKEQLYALLHHQVDYACAFFNPQTVYTNELYPRVEKTVFAYGGFSGKIMATKHNFTIEVDENGINYGKMETSSILTYVVKPISVSIDEIALSIGVWIKVKNHENEPIFTLPLSNNDKSKIVVEFLSGNIAYFLYDKDGNRSLDYFSRDDILIQKWNFIGFGFSFRKNNSGNFEKRFCLQINEKSFSFEPTTTTTNIQISVDNQIPLIFGNGFQGDITGILIGEGKLLLASKWHEYFQLTSNFFIHNQNKIQSKSIIIPPDEMKNHYDILPLNYDFISIQKLEPIACAYVEKYQANLSFDYDETLKHSVYHCQGQPLVYHFQLDTMGMIGMNIKLKEEYKKQWIIENQNGFSLFLENNSLWIDFLHQEMTTNLSLDAYQWYFLSLAWEKREGGYHLFIQLKNLETDATTKQFTYYWETDYLISASFTSLGGVYHPSTNQLSYPLDGWLQNVIFSQKYTSSLLLLDVLQEMINTDELGLVIEKEINHQLKNQITYTYQYPKNNLQIIPQVQNYQIQTSRDTYSIDYTYDSMGNIVTRNGDVFTYNAFNFLTHFKSLNLEENYVYDENNNIINITSNNQTKTFTYQHHLLVQVNDTPIQYQNGFPIQIGEDIFFAWKNQLLHSYVDISEEIEVQFCYNSNGQRISKNNIQYIYDGERLIIEKHSDYYLHFIYGLDNHLIGFNYVKEGIKKSFKYLYNLEGEIIFIIDNEGRNVVEYKYNPWGKFEIIDSSLEGIGFLNPFCFKEYYFDRETQLYWVSSRYYSPEWGRFIQPADVSSLNPQSINGLNLYIYALNNPISIAYSDVNVDTYASGGIANSTASSSCIFNSIYREIFLNSSNILGAFETLSSAFCFFDQWSGYLSGGLDAELGYLGSNGLGFRFLDKYSSILKKFGVGMTIVGNILSCGNSVYNNFTNPNYSTSEAIGASVMDAAYYTGKGFGTYWLGSKVGELAITAGIAVGSAVLGTTVFGTTIGFIGAFAIGGGVAVLVGIAGAVAIYYLGELLDYGWSELKKALFE